MSRLLTQILLTALAACLLALPVQAQGGSAADVQLQQAATALRSDVGALSPSETLLNARAQLQGATEGNTATVRQNGEANSVMLTQAGRLNTALVEQFGFDNAVTLLQQGQGNTTLAQQLGSGNVIDVTLIGEANRLDVRQVGQDNLYVLAFEGEGLTHSVLQQGQGIEAVQIGVGRQPVSIEQRGSGMRVMIEHNPAR